MILAATEEGSAACKYRKVAKSRLTPRSSGNGSKQQRWEERSLKNHAHTSFVLLIIICADLLAVGTFGTTATATTPQPTTEPTGFAQTETQRAAEPTGLELRWYDPFSSWVRRPSCEGRVVKGMR